MLRTFTSVEVKSFEQWLKSPWTNSNKNLVRLLEKVRKYHPEFDHPKLTKEKLFRQVLPNGKYSDRRMNNLLSEAYQAAERFLIFNHLLRNQHLQKDILTQEFQNRHLEDWFFRDAQKEIDRLATKPIQEWEDHLDLLRFYRRIYHHPTEKPRMQPGSQTIVEMGRQLDFVYLLEKAVIINEKIFRNRILRNEHHNIKLELSPWMKATESIHHPTIDLYKMRFSYEEPTMLQQYYILRATYLNCYTELNEKDQKVHLLSLLNDTIFLCKSDQLEVTETLPLYQLGLKTRLIFNEGILGINAFRTIVAASNYRNSFDYTHQFIENHLRHLEQEIQKDARNWALAHTLYWQNKLESSLDILIQHKFKTSYFQHFSRMLVTKVYFDLFLKDDSYQSYLFDYFNAFEKWITREKIGSDLHKKSYLKFIQKCRALAKIFSSIEFKIDKCDQIFQDKDNVQAIKWLEKKKEEIVKIRKKGISSFSKPLSPSNNY